MTLPREAAERLANLSIAVDNAHALLTSTTKRLEEVSKQLAMGVLTDSTAAEIELNKLRSQQSECNARYRIALGLHNEVRAWLNSQTHVTFELFEGALPDATVKKGETVEEAIDRVRSNIFHVSGELNLARLAPLPLEDRKTYVRSWVNTMAIKGAPTISTARAEVKILFAPDQGFATSDTEKMVALLAWANPDAMIERLTAQLEADDGRVEALSSEQRERRVADLTRKVDELVRAEVILVDRAIAQGKPITHRPDTPPAAFLGVRVKRKALRAVA